MGIPEDTTPKDTIAVTFEVKKSAKTSQIIG